MRPGLLLFPKFGSSFATFFDPADNSTVPIPWAGLQSTRLTAVVRDEAGTYWGIDRNFQVGRLDLSGQRLEAPISSGWFPAVARAGSRNVAIDRSSLRFVDLDLVTGTYTQIGTASVPCCSSYGLASDGTRLYVTARQGSSITLTTLDPATGALGTPVPLTAPTNFHVEEMRFFAGKLYATSRDSRLVTIDPATAVVTPLLSLGRNGAMEVYDPTARASAFGPAAPR
jgi:hypothetical protein